MTPFAIYLEKLRRSRGLQQKQVADALEITSCYISAMERGRKGPPTDKILHKLIKAFQLTPQQETELWLTVQQSLPIRKIPENASIQEHIFIKDLWEKLGTLNEEQLIAMSMILKLNNDIRTNFRMESFK